MRTRDRGKLRSWVQTAAAIALVIGLIVLACWAWSWLRRQALGEVSARTQLAASALTADAQARFARIKQGLRLLALRAPPGFPETNPGWRRDAEFYIGSFDGLSVIYWVDQDFLVRAAVSELAGDPPLGASAATLHTDTRQQLLWHAINLESGFGGFVVGLVDLRQFILRPFGDALGDYEMAVYRSGELIGTTADWLDVDPEFFNQSVIELEESSTLSVLLAPTPQHIDSALSIPNYVLLTSILLLGFIVAIGIVVSLRRRVRVQEQLSAQWRDFESVLDGIEQAVYVASLDSHEILFANRYLRDLLEGNPVGKICHEVLQGSEVPCKFCTNELLTELGGPYVWEHFNPVIERHYLITDHLIDWSNGEQARLEIAMDVTELKQAEEERRTLELQLRHAQKLESIGTLASGVAHEVNNPLMGMINYAELIKERSNDAEKVTEYSQEIIQEGFRIAEIVRNLLSFSRQDVGALVRTEVRSVLDSALSLLSSQLRKDQITVETEISPAKLSLVCRPQQLLQVIVNLLTNAMDALNDKYEGHDPDKKVEVRAWFDDEKNEVTISVADCGSGIPAEIQDRIFDPFFTSKPRTEGTGLGLAISHGIVEDHGGRITVESTEGVGTTCLVRLPEEPAPNRSEFLP